MKVSYQASDKALNPTEDKGIGVRYAAAKRGGFKGRWYLLLLLVIAPVAIVGWILLRPHLFVLASGIVTTEPLEVRAPSTGDVSTIRVKPGDTLNVGTPILSISDPQLNAQITELERQLAQLNIEDLSLNSVILKQLQTRIDVANEGVTRQDILLKSYENFQRKGVVPTSDMATVLQAHTASKMALEQAKVDLMQAKQKQLVELSAGVVTQSRRSIELQLVRLKAQQSQLQIKALTATRVVDILVQSGEHIVEDRPLALLAGRDNPVVLAFLEPKYLNYTTIGQQATITLANGDRFRASISEPTELVGRLPKQLSGPFDGEKPVLQITLKPEMALPVAIEGVPVEVSFDYVW
ncbi:HlyD family secretion protein [Shewanella sp. PP-He15 brown]|uniref:HlyD family secretion protein n=1 Tax=Shewanella baltica TaxID=62322 RepID=UPI0030757F7A